MRAKLPMAKAAVSAPKRPSRNSLLEERVAAFISSAGLPTPVRELRFAPPRMFRWDFCWPDRGIALEVQGGIWIHGAHSRGAGLADDCDKVNLAALHGWHVFKITERQIRDGSAFELIRKFLTTDIRYVSPVLTEAHL